MTQPLTYSHAAPVTSYARARDLLAAIRLHAARALKAEPPSPEAAALWQAAHGLEDLLRNHGNLGEPVEAIAARIADELGVTT